MSVAKRVAVAFLKGDAGVTARCNGRLYNNKAPQARTWPPLATDPGAFPHLVYAQINSDDINSNSGPGKTVRSQLQLDAYALSPDEADALAEAVMAARGGANVVPASADVAAFDGFRGTVNGIKVLMIDGNDARDVFEQPVHANDAGIHRVSMDFVVWTRES